MKHTRHLTAFSFIAMLMGVIAIIITLTMLVSPGTYSSQSGEMYIRAFILFMTGCGLLYYGIKDTGQDVPTGKNQH